MLCSVVVAREKITAIVTSMKTLCLRDILWNRLLWSDVSDEYEARRRRRTGDEEFRDPVSDSLLVKTEHYSTRSCFMNSHLCVQFKFTCHLVFKTIVLN